MSHDPQGLITFGEFQLAPASRVLRRSGDVIPLAPKTFDLLLLFAKSGGRVLTKAELMDTLWKDVFVEEASLLYQVSTLRKALGEEGAPWLETVPRVGYRFTAPVEQSSPPPSPPTPPPAQRRTALAILASALILAAGAYLYRGISQHNWARQQAIPEIASLADQGRFAAAFDLVQRVEPLLGNDDTQVAALQREVSRTVSFSTDPPGAEAFYRDLRSQERQWRPLGKTPLRAAPVPRGYFRLKFEKPGFETSHALFSAVADNVTFALYPKEPIPDGMVPVPEAIFDLPRRFAPPDRPNGPTRFLIDRFEVTHRQFKEFVDAGGYRNPSFWEHPFTGGRSPLSFEEAIATFVDSTGRPGPSTWIAGAIPPGREDFPVNGVSWYEAAAYAKFAGKQLPTVWHWYAAARLQSGTWVMPGSNFSGKDVARAGEYPGEGPHGTYDMAGNVKEWSWNETHGGQRLILGGAWNEATYKFAEPDARSPLDRSPLHGFRCVRYSTPPPAAWLAPLHPVLRDGLQKPASPELFTAYRGAYAYDRADLAATVDRSADESPYWRRQRITYTAAYGSQRIPALLFLPTQAQPPYRTIVYFPGAGALNSLSSESGPLEGWARLEFLLRAGRAVVYPIYQGTYERRPPATLTPLRRREMIIQQVQDLRRAIDYLQTRSDIDAGHLAFFGASVGAALGVIPVAVDDRLKMAVLADGGLYSLPSPPEVDPLHFAPRVTVPVLMLNGKNDYIYPLETSQKALFRLLGTPEPLKKHLLFDAAHEVVAVRTQVIREMLDWLDRHQGPTRPR